MVAFVGYVTFAVSRVNTMDSRTKMVRILTTLIMLEIPAWFAGAIYYGFLMKEDSLNIMYFVIGSLFYISLPVLLLNSFSNVFAEHNLGEHRVTHLTEGHPETLDGSIRSPLRDSMRKSINEF